MDFFLYTCLTPPLGGSLLQNSYQTRSATYIGRPGSDSAYIGGV